MSNILTNF